MASGSTTYLSGVSYAAFGGFAGHTYGNGIARAYTYNSLLQPSEMKDTGGGYTLLDNVLNWTGGTDNGNLPGQTVTHNGPNFSSAMTFSPSYGYDTLNRLTSAGETGNWSQSFGYDQYGNMWLSGNSGTLPTQVLMPNSQSAYNAANNRLTTPTYDAAGNQETFSTYTLTYDAENRQTKASDSSSGETYTYSYDGLGTRVSKTAQGVTTSYVHDVFGNLAAEYTSNTPVDQPCTTCYLSWDHLGSTRLVTDSGGVVVARHDFLPFGQEIPGGFGGRNDFWGQTDQVTAKFTSQEHDVETALDFFQSRYHANQQGRFLSADPGQAGVDITNPQSWNGYGYVLNSPLVNTDPDGTDTFDPDPIGDPCDDDPFCGWGGGFPPIWPGGNPQPPPPPPPPPAVSTGGLNVPNSGVYGSGWPGGVGASPFVSSFCGPGDPLCPAGGGLAPAILACLSDPACWIPGVIGTGAVLVYELSPKGPVSVPADWHYSGPKFIIQQPNITLMAKGGKQNVAHPYVQEMARNAGGDYCRALKAIMQTAKANGNNKLFQDAKATYKQDCRGYSN